MHVIIMRGMTGSGKTSIVKRLFKMAIVCSADRWFEKRKQRWNPRFLEEAHEACFSDFLEALANQVPLIVIDNTNLKEKDYGDYVDDALEAGYRVTFFHVMCDPEVAAERSKHRDHILQHGLKSMWRHHRNMERTPEEVDGEKVDSTEVWTSNYPGPEPDWDQAASMVSTTA